MVPNALLRSFNACYLGMSKFSQFAFYMSVSLPVVSKSLAQWFLTGETCLPRGGVKRFHGEREALCAL